ncbi:peptidoglycan-binding protein [Bacillus sp. SM2101]|uniref:peptidoglycan-binding protein n=1 Tax=Bacillus sp. SM2101 TaxID=2805366 RepID=UPI001BDE7B0F|nr:peptidoglycan-binding protein [Bacillus sp. SM2101]
MSNYGHYLYFPQNVLQSPFSRKESFRKTNPNEELRSNSNTVDPYFRQSTGKLIVSVYEKNTLKPIKGAAVSISKKNSQIITIQQTDELGLINTVILPAPSMEYTSLPTTPDITPYSVYNVIVESPGYVTTIIRGVQIFANTTAKQKVELTPVSQVTDPQPIIIDIPERILIAGMHLPHYQRYSPELVYPYINIPEFVILHVRNHNQIISYKVRIKDYIKNIASCEICPSLPYKIIRGHVFCIISFTLYRIYNGFTITKSNCLYLHGRHTYKEIDDVVDDII